MQPITVTNAAELLAPGQQPKMRLWIDVAGWIPIHSLDDKNYLKDVSFSSGGAKMSPNPIAGQFSAIINNAGNIFHPDHPTSAPYNTYFRAGRKVKIEIGGIYPSGEEIWQRIIGYMDEPEFSSDTFELTITGLDYMKVLTDMKFSKIISIWEVNFDGGQNEPAVGDDVGTPTDDNFFITAYSLTSGSWAGNDAAGKLWLQKPGFNACGWVNNEDITNNTQANTLAGGAGLGVNGVVIKTYTPIDNYWGALHIFDSVSTAGALGIEIYAEDDAMDTGDIGVEAPNVTNWAVLTNGATAFTWEVQTGGFSNWEGKFVANPEGILSVIENPDVCNITKDNEYLVTFKYKRTAGSHSLNVGIRQGVTVQGFVAGLNSDDWADGYFYFKALSTGVAAMRLRCKILDEGTSTFRIDNISIKHVTSSTWYRYPMPALCTGIYYVELDEGSGFQPVWPGKQKGEGWYYDAENQYFYFDEDKAIDNGTANLCVYYYTAQAAEDVVADILVKAKFYTIRAAAITAMGGAVAVATGISIPRVRFEGGSPYIDAVRMICERCNWRFYFDWGGIPVFIPAPGFTASIFTFNPQHFTSPKLYQDRSEIWNRIIIEGEKIAELVGWEDNMPSELKNEASDPTSINLYGENTKTIKNILFQTLGDITAMCAVLLAAYKNPKWYFDFETPYNAVPLELCDPVLVQELLDIALPVAQRYVTHTCLIRDADVSRYNVTYKCEMVGGCMIVPPEGDVAEKWEHASGSDKFMYAYVGNCDANSFVSDGSPLKIVCKCE